MDAPKVKVYVMEVKDILKDLSKIILTYMPMHLILYKTPKEVFQNCELCQTNVMCPFLEQSQEGLVCAVFCLK